MRAYIRTGNQAYTPQINDIAVGYYIPHVFDDTHISVPGATSGSEERYRVIKVLTSDSGLDQSRAFMTFADVSDASVFARADMDLQEVPTHTIVNQFAFPPFPVTPPVDATQTASFDANNAVALYFTHERTSGGTETMDYVFVVDINGFGGPRITHDVQLNIDGI